MNDASGTPLKRGAVYAIESAPECCNRFRCTRTGPPNHAAFRRIGDKMKHIGREFVEFRNGRAYYDLKEAER